MTNRPTPADGHALLQRFRSYLNDRSLPVTQQRMAVAKAVFFSDRRSSVNDIESDLRHCGVAVGTATVYRTLELLRAAGLVDEHDFGEGFKRYEPMVGRGHHEHLICTECGRVVAFTNERLERMRGLIADEHGFRSLYHRLEIYGLCHECQRRDAMALRHATSTVRSDRDD